MRCRVIFGCEGFQNSGFRDLGNQAIAMHKILSQPKKMKMANTNTATILP